VHSATCDLATTPGAELGRHPVTEAAQAVLRLNGRLAELAQAAELSVRSILAGDPAMKGDELLRRLEERARVAAADFARSSAELSGDDDPTAETRLG
jgi:hypothetical protein